MKDVSHGGAQILFPEHFPSPSQLARLLEDWKRHLPKTRTSGRIGSKTKGWSIQTQPSLAVTHRPSEGYPVEADRLFTVISLGLLAPAHPRARGGRANQKRPFRGTPNSSTTLPSFTEKCRAVTTGAPCEIWEQVLAYASRQNMVWLLRMPASPRTLS